MGGYPGVIRGGGGGGGRRKSYDPVSEESSGRRVIRGKRRVGVSRGLQGSSGVGGQEKVILPCMWDYQGSMS